MILPYFAISLAMYWANSTDVEPIDSKPSVDRRALTSGFASTSATLDCSFAVIAGGRSLGPQRPYHDTNSNPGNPDSSTVGMSGAAGWRLRLVMASALMRPACACG